MAGRLILRADAGPEIGTGHVMRSLALASAWQAHGGTVELASHALPAWLAERARQQGVARRPVPGPPGGSRDAEATIALCRSDPGERPWIVCDGYHFGMKFQAVVRQSNARLLLIDDYGSLDQYDADLVLNQNMGADARWYDGEGRTAELLLGPRFALLRPEFLMARRRARLVRRRAERLLVTLGGADPHNTAARCVEMLAGRRYGLPRDVRVIAGAVNRHRDELRRTVARSVNASGRRIALLPASHRMVEHMLWADLVIAAAGSTVWELACVGTPFFSIVLADNQRRIAAELDARLPGTSWGDATELDPSVMVEALLAWSEDFEGRCERAIALRRLVDGRGAARVVQRMLDAAEEPTAAVNEEVILQ